MFINFFRIMLDDQLANYFLRNKINIETRIHNPFVLLNKVKLSIGNKSIKHKKLIKIEYFWCYYFFR